MGENNKPSKYHDQRWKDLVKKVFERDDYICTSCKQKSGYLRGHHMVYVKGRDVWDYPDVAITTMCKECHDHLHNSGHQVPLFSSMEDALCFLAVKKISEVVQTSVNDPIPLDMATVPSAPIEQPKGSKTRPVCADGCDTIRLTEGRDQVRYADRKSMIRRLRRIKNKTRMSFSEMMKPFFEALIYLEDELLACKSIRAWRKLVKSHFAW